MLPIYSCISFKWIEKNCLPLFFFFISKKNSGRTEKQAVRDALAHARSPPNFKRTPSRRQPRRTFDNNFEAAKHTADTNKKSEVKSVSIPQPAQA